MIASGPGAPFGIAFVLAAAVSAGLIVVLRPVLVRYAMARPTARSSHRVPTPQGGGIAVVAATLAGTALAAPLLDGAAAQAWPIALAAVLLAAVGCADDILSLPVAPRLALQCAGVALVLVALPGDLRVLPLVPMWLERLAMLVAGVYVVNIVNFMDGIDWMTVAEFVPVTGGLVLLALLGALSPLEATVAIALCGALIGFAPFNRPVAALFLGDVGSLPLGLILFWLLTQLAGRGHLAAALLLPLYYLMDATITLGRRLMRGEKIHQAHRTHFYQRATDLGFSVIGIVTRVFLVNLGLVGLAVVSVAGRSPAVAAGALAAGLVLVAGLLRHLSQVRS